MLLTTEAIKVHIGRILEDPSVYFDTLQEFLGGRISRLEFEDSTRQILYTPQLIQLHNALIISLFDVRGHQRPSLSEAQLLKLPPRKKRRTFPYQGDDIRDALRSGRLKRSTLSLGKRERQRLHGASTSASLKLVTTPSPTMSEISYERGVVLILERDDPAGSRPPVSLSTVTRTMSSAAIAERTNLICAQHNLAAPSTSVNDLVMAALQMKLKQMIIHAITLTSSSDSLNSINASITHERHQQLTAPSFGTVFEVSSSSVPERSAAVTHLVMGVPDYEEEQVALLRDRQVEDQRWQMFALLGERSTVKEAYRASRI